MADNARTISATGNATNRAPAGRCSGGGWKLVHHAVSKNGEPELYQIGKELAETSGLAAPHPDRVAAMPGIIEERRMPSPVFPDKSLDRQQLTASP